MGVTPQQITKIVKGKENLTLDTQIKLQEILDIPILASYYDKMWEQIVSDFLIKDTKKYTAPKNPFLEKEDEILLTKMEIVMEYDASSETYEHYKIPA